MDLLMNYVYPADDVKESISWCDEFAMSSSHQLVQHAQKSPVTTEQTGN